MKQSLDRFIMKVPYPLFKKVLYIYVGAVIFWDSAPFASMVLCVILATLLTIGYQSRVRIADAIQKHSSSDDIYSEAMRGPITYWGPRLFVVSIASALTGYFLDGQFGLKGVQIFFLIMGYAVFYRETNLLGAFVNYIITDRGIGIYYIPGHNVYQLFINFSEIKSITVVKDNNSPSPLWTCLTPYDAKMGLMPAAGDIERIEEPWVMVSVVTPTGYIGPLMELSTNRRGVFVDMEYLDPQRVLVRFEIPLAEVIVDYYDQLKSRSQGYASMDYEEIGYRSARLVKLDVLVNGEPVDALSLIVHRDDAQAIGRRLAAKLKELMPRQMFEVPVQAAIGSNVVARETIRAMRKNVLAKCYGLRAGAAREVREAGFMLLAKPVVPASLEAAASTLVASRST